MRGVLRRSVLQRKDPYCLQKLLWFCNSVLVFMVAVGRRREAGDSAGSTARGSSSRRGWDELAPRGTVLTPDLFLGQGMCLTPKLQDTGPHGTLHAVKHPGTGAGEISGWERDLHP